MEYYFPLMSPRIYVIRIYVQNNVKEESINLSTLTITTKAVDICNPVNTHSAQKICPSKNFSVTTLTTDGVRCMIERENGFINLLKKLLDIQLRIFITLFTSKRYVPRQV